MRIIPLGAAAMGDPLLHPLGAPASSRSAWGDGQGSFKMFQGEQKPRKLQMLAEVTMDWSWLYNRIKPIFYDFLGIVWIYTYINQYKWNDIYRQK